MERAELVRAAEILLKESPRAHPAYVEKQGRDRWLKQLVRLFEDVVAHADLWGLLPPIDRDRPPPKVELLGATLGFLDSTALYRVLPWTSDGDLIVRVERTPFSSFCRRVTVGESGNGRSTELRSWQFLADDEEFNLHVFEGPYTSEFVHEFARRIGWPLPQR